MSPRIGVAEKSQTGSFIRVSNKEAFNDLVRVIKGMAGRHVLGVVHRQLFQGHDRDKRRWE